LDEDKPIFTPEDFIRYEASCRGMSNAEQFRIPSRLILLYQTRAFEYVSQVLDEKIPWLYGPFRPVCIGTVGNKRIGAFKAGIGAPSTAAILEELIACGAKNVIEVGVAGSLQPSLKPGDLVVVNGAFRDEGTSNHYFPQEVRLAASPRLKNLLIQYFNRKELNYQVGPVWTTDGVYRETRSKFLRFRNRGALAVNMETSALFAVAKHRQVELASIQVISDVLSEKRWTPAFHQKKVLDRLRAAVDVGIEALEKM